MKPVTVVVSLPIADVERSLRFYRDGLGLAAPEADETMIAFELPNLSLFLIEKSQYGVYLARAGVAPHAPAAGACALSCAMGSKAEIDDILAQAQAAGGSVARPAGVFDGSYTGYFSDPDGHLWELVHNARTEQAAASQT